MSSHDRVGPVLVCGVVAEAVLAAIRAENAGVEASHGGGYWRISVQGRCRVSRAGIEKALGRAFALPRDLEAIMPSFKGRLRLSDDAVSWEH
jgi:hypothetical protein